MKDPILRGIDPNFEVIDVPKVYPRVHLLPNGQVFCSTPLGTVPKSQFIDLFTGIRSFAGDAPPDRINTGEFFTQEGTSVLLPLLPSEGYPRASFFAEPRNPS